MHTDGIVSYDVSFLDIVGNISDISSGSGVTIDLIPLDLSVTSFLSSNDVNTLAKENDIITLLFSSNETIQIPTVLFDISGTSVDSNLIDISNNSYLGSACPA